MPRPNVRGAVNQTPLRPTLTNTANPPKNDTTMNTKLPEFKNGMDSRCRDYPRPTVARFWVSPTDCRFAVVGTAYGHLYTTGGNVRTWKSYSGARRAARNYVSF